MQAHEKIIAAIGIATLALIGYQETRLTRIETAVKETQEQVAEVKRIVTYGQPLNLSKREMECLALNIFHEAGVEPDLGKVAVANVTINRLKTKRWGTNLCDVVYAHAQFSWTLLKDKRSENPKGPLWEQSQLAAKEAADGLQVVGLEESLHYHATYVNPKWNKAKVQVAHIGRHIFYRKST